MVPDFLGELDDVVDDILHCLSLGCFVKEDFIVSSCILKGDDEIIRSDVLIYPDLFLLVGVIGIEGLDMFVFLGGVEDKTLALFLGELVGVYDFLEEIGVRDDASGF